MFQNKCRGCVIASALLLCCTLSAAAQDQGRVGLTMWYPVGLGVVFDLSDHFTLRPDVSMTREVSGGLTDVTSKTWCVGLSALFHLQKSDSLSTYLSPRVAYGRSNGDYSWFEGMTESYQVSGSLGAQYALARSFSVFGELGIAYTDLRMTESNSWRVRKTRTWEARTIVGVIVFF